MSTSHVSAAALLATLALAACGGSPTPAPAADVAAARPAPVQAQKKSDCAPRSPLLGMSAGREQGCAPEPTPEAVKSCADESIWRRAVQADADFPGNQASCKELPGGAIVAAAWHVSEPFGKKELAGMACYYAKDARFCRSLDVSGAEIDKVLQRAESSDLAASVEGGLLRVGVVTQVGEDYATVNEIVSLFGLDGRYLHKGLGTSLESDLDVCTREERVTFTLSADGSIERRVEPRASFEPRPLDAKLLARLKKGCVPAAGGVRVTTLPALSR